MACFHALELAREDVLRACAALSEEDLYASHSGLTPIAYHLRHIPRSLDRLLTYAEGNPLGAEQHAALKSESDPGANRQQLLDEFEKGMDAASDRLLPFATLDLELTRAVGRKNLPTTVGGLLVHLADHTQRHAGQIVTSAKVIRAMR